MDKDDFDFLVQFRLLLLEIVFKRRRIYLIAVSHVITEALQLVGAGKVAIEYSGVALY